MSTPNLARLRGVTTPTPCPSCAGWGRRHYSNGNTWRRGGMATQAFAWDVCDTCWGSGDAERPGEDLRALHAARKAWEEEQVIDYLTRRTGAPLQSINMRAKLREVAGFCKKMGNKRAYPAGNPFWERQAWHILERVFSQLGTE